LRTFDTPHRLRPWHGRCIEGIHRLIQLRDKYRNHAVLRTLVPGNKNYDRIQIEIVEMRVQVPHQARDTPEFVLSLPGEQLKDLPGPETAIQIAVTGSVERNPDVIG
jgi:thiol-disulfide isomerase/thioredoxin